MPVPVRARASMGRLRKDRDHPGPWLFPENHDRDTLLSREARELRRDVFAGEPDRLGAGLHWGA